MENINNQEPAQSGAFMTSLKRNYRQIREDRALSIAEDAEMLYKRKIEDLSVLIKRMKRDQENMLDLSPSSMGDLKVASDFDAELFVSKDLDLSIKIRNKEIELNLAKKNYNHLFGYTYELTQDL